MIHNLISRFTRIFRWSPLGKINWYTRARGRVCAVILILFGLYPQIAAGASRFPHPDFESSYTVPGLSWLTSRAVIPGYIDLIALGLALSIAAWLVIKGRSRNSLVLLSLCSLAYFGFIKKGCVCVAGSLQNMTLALFDGTYQIPVTVLVFFMAPLLFALFFGRIFCGAVCPVGVIQDLVILKPVKLPAWLTQALSLFPYIYLGLAVLWAATGTGFLICRYDPFIGFFRLTGATTTIILGASFLLLGTVIARPYCRFVCPYGVLLSWMAPFSRKRLQVTPDTCIQCRLCEDACPSGLLQRPVINNPSLQERRAAVRNLAQLVLLLPVLAGLGGFAGSRLAIPLANYHPQVALYHQVQTEIAQTRAASANTAVKNDAIQTSGNTLETKAFWETGKTVNQLAGEAGLILRRFYFGGWLLGGFLGLVIGLKIIGLSLRRTRAGYEPDRAHCFSCGRCLDYCPVNRPVRAQAHEAYHQLEDITK